MTLIKSDLKIMENNNSGKSKKEVLLSTYICHPSMANNETSGISVLIYLSKWIQNIKKKILIELFLFPKHRFFSIFEKKLRKNEKKYHCWFCDYVCRR